MQPFYPAAGTIRLSFANFRRFWAVAARVNSSCTPHGPRNRRRPSPRMRLRCANTAVDAVLQVFRRRLNAQEGLEFASVLPSVLRAIFVHNWDVTEPRAEFYDREKLVSEVKAVRVNHNLTPDNAIEATAWAVRRSTNQRDFERVLAKLPAEARDFWHVDVVDPAELEQRII